MTVTLEHQSFTVTSVTPGWSLRSRCSGSARPGMVFSAGTRNLTRPGIAWTTLVSASVPVSFAGAVSD